MADVLLYASVPGSGLRIKPEAMEVPGIQRGKGGLRLVCSPLMLVISDMPKPQSSRDHVNQEQTGR